MKKFIFLLCSILILCGCSSDNGTDITASMLLPAEQLVPYLDYTPTFNEKTTRRYSIAEYRPDTLGSNDPVIIKVYQENQLLSKDKIFEYFNECKELRTDAFTIDSLGVDCFVAYPSIHCYVDGFHIEITAGSGSDNNQKILLMNLARLSLENLDGYKNVLSSND